MPIPRSQEGLNVLRNSLNKGAYFCHCDGQLIRPLIRTVPYEFTSLLQNNWIHPLPPQHELNIMKGYQINSLREMPTVLLALIQCCR